MKTPKLICESPWLNKPPPRWGFWWSGVEGSEDGWLCHEPLARLFKIARGTKRMRAYLYDGKPPNKDARQIRFLRSGSRSVAWTADLKLSLFDSGGGRAVGWGWLVGPPADLVLETLLKHQRINMIKLAWLAIETED